MRSTVFTFILVLFTVLVCGVAGWSIASGDLGVLFGVPPTPAGERLYASFKADEVQRIQVSTKHVSADFVKTNHGWVATQPWQDRMDPQAAMAIIGFTLGMRVEDSAALDEIPVAETGLRDDEAVSIRLEGGNGRPVAKYRLGKRSPWLAPGTDNAERIPTVYVQPTDKNRKSHVFICSGDILPLFRDNLKFLRDHHPFFFHPALLSEIRFRSSEGELTLGRATPQDAWRIIKPLELRTDPAAIKALVEGLGNLVAVSVADRGAVTLPTTGKAEANRQIGLVCFGSPVESVLEIYPPESAAAHDVLATMSDRPGTVFSLPLKPERELVSLADLPATVNDLRDPQLTHLNLEGLRAVSIQPSTGEEIFIARTEPKLWTTMIDGVKCQANEGRLVELLTAVSSERAIGFESDAATDFAPWGLDRPFLKLGFIGQDGREFTLRFGMDKHGTIFANRLGTPSVMKLDRSFLASIAIHAYEWRHARLWSLSRFDLVAIERTVAGQPKLTLLYEFTDDSWQASADGADVSDAVNPAKANYLLGGVEGLEVTRWLSPADEAATAALAQPVLTLVVRERQVPEPGADEAGGDAEIRRELHFAPVAGPTPAQLYYGRLAGDRYPFLVDAATYEKLAVDPLAEK
jgi:hypothetical protein